MNITNDLILEILLILTIIGITVFNFLTIQSLIPSKDPDIRKVLKRNIEERRS